MRGSIIGLLSITLLLLGAFQNCGKLGFSTGGTDKSSGGGLAHLFATHPATVAASGGAPSLAVNAHPSQPQRGARVMVTALPQNLDQVSYACAVAGHPDQIVSRGDLSADEMMFQLTIDSDLECTFVGRNGTSGKSLTVPLAIAVDCGAQTKTSAGLCVDYVCRSYRELAATELAQVPARTDDGACFYTKIVAAVSAGATDAGAATDPDISIHDPSAGDAGASAPRSVATWAGSFALRGPRAVRLFGAADAPAPLVIDDLLILGLRTTPAPVDVTNEYRALGAATLANLVVEFRQTHLTLNTFADDGVTTRGPIEVTAFAGVGQTNYVELRAASVGGRRELSDVYLRFE